MKILWLKLKRSVLYHFIRLFRIRGASEKVARGFSLGLIVNFFPTFGFGVLVSGVFARLLGGNAIAGFVGGALLNFFWPFLFYLNMQMGAAVQNTPALFREPSEVTETAISALVWGKTFMTGAIVNAVFLGTMVYSVLRLIHEKIRPGALAYFRRHAREHRKLPLPIRPSCGPV